MSTKVKYGSRPKTHGNFRSKGFRWGWHRAENLLLRFGRPVSNRKEVTDEMLETVANAIENVPDVESVRVASTTGAFLVSIQELDPNHKQYTMRREDLIDAINHTIVETLIIEFKKIEAQIESETAARRRTDHQSFSYDKQLSTPRRVPSTPLPSTA